MDHPQNLSGDSKGFNSRMFKSNRAVRRGFWVIGYDVDAARHKVSRPIVEKFQGDYNRCAERFEHWGKVNITGELDQPTLNALEHAIRWAKNREKKHGAKTCESWQSLCSVDRSYEEKSEPEHSESNFVEVLPNGGAKLRNIHTDDALRCNVLSFERHGDMVFAVVIVPPQGDLPGGRPNPITCPCILGR